VTAAFARLAEQRANVTLNRFDTQPDTVSGGVGYHARRLWAHARAAGFLALSTTRRPCILYVGGAGGWGLLHQLSVMAIARARRVRVVFHHHSYAYLGERSRVMACVVRMLGEDGTNVVLCPRMADDLRRLYAPRGPIVTLSNAAFAEDAEPVEAFRGDEAYVVGHVSNLSSTKGLAVVLDAARRLLHEQTLARFVLAGPCAAADDRDRIEALLDEFPGRASYRGALPHSSVASFLAGCDLFLFPSRYRHEAEPLVVLESLAVGTPVLAFRVGCLGNLGPGVTVVETATDFHVALDAAWSERCTTNRDRDEIAETFARRKADSRLAAHRLLDSLLGEA
jgi:glycosyltransferase involved in cell wall biosynthesis